MGTKQPLYVNGKIFNSMNKAAKFLRISVSTLADRLRNKEATVYKDILVEKAKIEPKPQPKLLKRKRKGIPILVDGKMYNSCKEAELSIGCAQGSIADALRRRGKTLFLGHLIEPIYPSMVGKRKRRTKDAVKVLCKTTGVTYNTIVEASKVAEVDDWTMSKKMETAGGFIDKNGNEYVRLTPMVSKNSYGNTGKTLKREIDPKNRFIGCETLDKIDMGNFCEPLTEVNFDKKEVPQIVKDAINEKIIQILKDKGCYEDIVDLLNYGGFSTIKVIKG